jgi:hypothetical protein
MYTKRAGCVEHQIQQKEEAVWPALLDGAERSWSVKASSRRLGILKVFTMLRLFSDAGQGDNKAMRGWLFKAALVVALLTTPVWAQRGGGGHGGMGGGFHGGGFHGGGFRGGAAGYGYHGGARSAYRGGGYGYRGGAAGYGYRGWNGNHWNGNYWHGNYWRGNYWRGNGWYRGRYYRPFGFGWGGYPWWGWGIGWGWNSYPGWSWGWYPGWYGGVGYDDDSYSTYPYSYTASNYSAQNYQAQNYQAQNYPSDVYLNSDGQMQYSNPKVQDQQQQIDRLQGEVDQLKTQQKQTSAGGPAVTEVHYDTVLVYRDGHTETVRDYAIVGKTLWVFNESRARRIPLAELDIPATKRDNQDRGNEFIVPSSR